MLLVSDIEREVEMKNVLMRVWEKRIRGTGHDGARSLR